jgi:regulator of protease activity HflC (stomatin/prohibitin superfamily)
MLLAFFIVILYNTIKILKEYERGVIFFLGRFQSVKGPGLIILIPGLQKMTKVDLRVIVLDVPTQDVISRDNVSVKVNAVIYFRIVDPEKAVIRVANVFEATSQLSQTTLRSVLGQHELDDMLAERDKLNSDIQDILDQRTDNWGIKVASRQKQSEHGAPKLLTLKAKNRRPICWRRRQKRWRRKSRLCNCVTCKP